MAIRTNKSRKERKDKKKFRKLYGLGMACNSDVHQNIISRLYDNITERFPFLQGHIRSEINVIKKDGTKGRRYPDLTVWEEIFGRLDDSPQNLLIAIEITNSIKNNQQALRCIIDAYQKHPEMHEAFIYNYKRNTWKRIAFHNNEVIIEENCDFSEYLQTNLNEILYNNVYNLENNSFIKYDVYDETKYNDFDQEGLEIISKIRERLVAVFPEKELNIRDDIKLSDHLIGNGVYAPAVSFWKNAELQGENALLKKLQLIVEIATNSKEAYLLAESSFEICSSLQEVVVYNLISEEWTCYRFDIEDGIIEVDTDRSKVLKINMYDVVGMM